MNPVFLCDASPWSLPRLAAHWCSFPSAEVHLVGLSRSAALFVKHRVGSQSVVIAKEHLEAKGMDPAWDQVLRLLREREIGVEGVLSEDSLRQWGEQVLLPYALSPGQRLLEDWAHGLPSDVSPAAPLTLYAGANKSKHGKEGLTDRQACCLQMAREFPVPDKIHELPWPLIAHFGMSVEPFEKRQSFLALARCLTNSDTVSDRQADALELGRQRLEAVRRELKASRSGFLIFDADRLTAKGERGFLHVGPEAFELIIGSAAAGRHRGVIIAAHGPAFPRHFVRVFIGGADLRDKLQRPTLSPGSGWGCYFDSGPLESLVSALDGAK